MMPDGRRRPAVRAREGMANASTILQSGILSGEGLGNADTRRNLSPAKRTGNMRNHRDAKAMAKAMRETLAESQIDIPHSQALEIVARQFGLASWNVLSAKIEAEEGGPTRQGGGI